MPNPINMLTIHLAGLFFFRLLIFSNKSWEINIAIIEAKNATIYLINETMQREVF